jgi:hypothetical protein
MSTWGGWVSQGRTWRAVDGMAQVSYPYSATLPSIQDAMLVAGATASGGAFTGDLRGVDGLSLIGFDFYADDVKPADLMLDIVGAGRRYRVYLTDRVAAVGTRQRFVVPIDRRAAAPWVLDAASDAAFGETLAAVDRVEITVTPSGRERQRYRVDNVFLDATPSVGAVEADGVQGGMALVWQAVRAESSYRLEATTDLSAEGGGWFDTGVRMQADGDALRMPLPETDGENVMIYRLRMEP